MLQVRKDIEAAMEIDEDYDDGSFGPVLVRLAWHASGTYSKKERDGENNYDPIFSNTIFYYFLKKIIYNNVYIWCT